MNNSSLAKQLGRWNPQLLREFRGRLKPRTVIVAIALSAIFQIFLNVNLPHQIPAPPQQTAGWMYGKLLLGCCPTLYLASAVILLSAI
ncbi:MAG: hypothetical protein HC942_26060 [Microcoleus sp. SU_5_6]|nr:hypothetical protein [Microcoleus sp. SU_5_6]